MFVYLPSIVDRSPLLVAISSGGTAPVLARVLREKIEALLPTSLGRMAEKASFWRNHLKTRLTSVTERRRFWERVFRGRFASLMQAGNETAAQKILEDELDNPGSTGGEIILVGAGPGDAGLLTLRGLQVLQDADVVFYDHLVTDGVRELIRRDAEQICVGKRAGEHSVPQHDTNQMLVDAAKAGKTVVRLKGGDPFIFGRGGEELQAAAEAGVLFRGARHHGGLCGDGLRRYPADPPRLRPERDLCDRPLQGRQHAVRLVASRPEPPDAGDLHGHDEGRGHQRTAYSARSRGDDARCRHFSRHARRSARCDGHAGTSCNHGERRPDARPDRGG